jgi:hypothetical protein
LSDFQVLTSKSSGIASSAEVAMPTKAAKRAPTRDPLTRWIGAGSIRQRRTNPRPPMTDRCAKLRLESLDLGGQMNGVLGEKGEARSVRAGLLMFHVEQWR